MGTYKKLAKVLYGYIGFACFMVILNLMGVFRPAPDIIAVITLLVACYYVGRYSDIK